MLRLHKKNPRICLLFHFVNASMVVSGQCVCQAFYLLVSAVVTSAINSDGCGGALMGQIYLQWKSPISGWFTYKAFENTTISFVREVPGAAFVLRKLELNKHQWVLEYHYLFQEQQVVSKLWSIDSDAQNPVDIDTNNDGSSNRRERAHRQSAASNNTRATDEEPQLQIQCPRKCNCIGYTVQGLNFMAMPVVVLMPIQDSSSKNMMVTESLATEEQVDGNGKLVFNTTTNTFGRQALNQSSTAKLTKVPNITITHANADQEDGGSSTQTEDSNDNEDFMNEGVRANVQQQQQQQQQNTPPEDLESGIRWKQTIFTSEYINLTFDSELQTWMLVYHHALIAVSDDAALCPEDLPSNGVWWLMKEVNGGACATSEDTLPVLEDVVFDLGQSLNSCSDYALVKTNNISIRCIGFGGNTAIHPRETRKPYYPSESISHTTLGSAFMSSSSPLKEQDQRYRHITQNVVLNNISNINMTAIQNILAKSTTDVTQTKNVMNDWMNIVNYLTANHNLSKQKRSSNINNYF